MPWKEGATVGEAREILSNFLQETGCYTICAQCPVYPGGEGCCHGCGKLSRNESGGVTGCGQPNLSCLSYTCSVLDRHLIESERFEEFNDLVYGIPREGYRGCQPRQDKEVLQITDPLREIKATIDIDIADKEYSLSAEEGEE